MEPRNRIVICLLTTIVAGLACGPGRAMDEARLVPTGTKVDAKADKEFTDAMAVWFKHDYANGQKMLTEFSQKHPDSRGTAESNAHAN